MIILLLAFVPVICQPRNVDYTGSAFAPAVTDALTALLAAFRWPVYAKRPNFDCSGLSYGIRCASEAPVNETAHRILTALTLESADEYSVAFVPTQIGRLTSLTDLTIKDVKFTTLPNQMSKLSGLKRLALGDVNLLAPIPRALIQQPGLQTCVIRVARSAIGRDCTTCDAGPFCEVTGYVSVCDHACVAARLQSSDIVTIHNKDVRDGFADPPLLPAPHVLHTLSPHMETSAAAVSSTVETRVASSPLGTLSALSTPVATSASKQDSVVVQSSVAERTDSMGIVAPSRPDYRFVYAGVAVGVCIVCLSVAIAVPVVRAYSASAPLRDAHGEHSPRPATTTPARPTRTSEYDRVPTLHVNGNGAAGEHYQSSFQHLV